MSTGLIMRGGRLISGFRCISHYKNASLFLMYNRIVVNVDINLHDMVRELITIRFSHE